ncbi:MAG: DUF4251 domain-containing protein [Chitinophaga sp.]|uniref:DUF4251 domain-containing protein n=1 Tax=Chitinophaga sp. TaxID=1869181 RepID=UPI0025B8CA3F|nr:DUF4251 domain-containing protein [Chitinophaga sp.]MBV8252153.1 DUF4251 domain-containing protein [Chitinophaga sp.]
MKRLILHVMLSGVLLTAATMQLSAQKKETRAEKQAVRQAQVAGWVNSQQFVYVPQTAIPMGGRVVQLTPDFSFEVTKDSIVSYLPYYGRAYTAPIDPTKNAMNFKTKDFTYEKTVRKKGGWDITIKPKDNSDINSINLSIGPEGYGSLQVTSYNTQPISFNGVIQENKERKAKKNK